MHKIQEEDMLPLNIEIKRTLKNLRKITVVESRSMANQRERLHVIPKEEEEVERTQRPNTMVVFWRPIIQEEYFVVRQAAIKANNFELKPSFFTMVQQHQFTTRPSVDPNEHMGRFMRMANTIKLNEVRPEVIKLQLFPFSMRDVAATWFNSLPIESVNSWEDLV